MSRPSHHIEAMIDVTCTVCGLAFPVKKYRAATAQYCSYICRDEGYRRKERKPSVEKMAAMICQQCGKPFEVSPSRAKHGRGLHCSTSCQYAAIKARPKRNMAALTCIGCGKAFTRRDPALSDSKVGGGKFCTRSCRDANRTGALHPQFISGTDAHRGPHWQARKRAAKKRDNQVCQHCGAVGTDAHHIRPFRFFSDAAEANRLDNLITLCRPCHRRADAAIQRSGA